MRQSPGVIGKPVSSAISDLLCRRLPRCMFRNPTSLKLEASISVGDSDAMDTPIHEEPDMFSAYALAGELAAYTGRHGHHLEGIAVSVAAPVPTGDGWDEASPCTCGQHRTSSDCSYRLEPSSTADCPILIGIVHFELFPEYVQVYGPDRVK